MENWKVLFRPHILERGLNYYEMGAVENVQKTETGLFATVVGNDNYEVEIKITDGRVYDMWCSCPYAEDGNNCKHMRQYYLRVMSLPMGQKKEKKHGRQGIH